MTDTNNTDIYSRPSLIFSDDKVVSKDIEKTLSTLQYKVDSVVIESEAIKMLGEKEYFLIVVVEKPKRQLETLSFYKKIIANHPQYKNSVIFVSESIFGILAEEVKLIGCELIPKPFYAENLASSLDTMRERGLFKEHRTENRYNWIGDCNITTEGGTYRGRTMDISTKGMKIYYIGEKPKAEEKITISLEKIDHSTGATVMWSYKVGDKALIGISLEDNLTGPSLKKAIPFAPL